jgi:type IX secretion system PorP/SprF family membrane protein
MKKIIYTFLLMPALVISAAAQDVQFSFPEFAPLSLNPALAGANYAMEGIVNYRNQWSSLGDPYRTTAASFHTRLKGSNKRKTNQLAAGLQLMNDKAGSSAITNNSVALSIANHVSLSRNSRIGAGLNFGYVQRSIGNPNGQWASQYDGAAYNGGLASGESLNNPSFGYFDMGAGILYTYEHRQSTLAKNHDKLLNAGVAVYHVNRPNNSFVAPGEDRLPVRYSAFANGEFAISSTNLSVLPGVWYNRQGIFSQLLVGTSLKFLLIGDTRYTGFTKPLALSMGLFGRLNDAAILRFNLDWDRYSFGYAFDFNTSGLNDYTGGRGAQEVFLRFFLNENRPMRSGGRYASVEKDDHQISNF